MLDRSESTGGLVAGRYRLGRLLGSGAVAEVYRALDVRLGRLSAVKMFRPDPDTVAQHRYLNEARALARMSHPALVAVYDSGVDDNRPYLVMQFVDGGSLRDRIVAGPLPVDETIRIGARLADAVAHVHGRDIVHRDIKPSNILLDTDGDPYLADFGIALLAEATRLTGSDQVMGSAAYLAPEQVLGRPVGPPADVYTLGLVLLECVTGELEYPGPNKAEAALARLSRPPHIPPELPEPFAELLRAMTSTDPTARPTAEDCAARLRELATLEDVSNPVVLRSVVGPPAPPHRSRHWRPVALVGVLVVVMAMAGWALTTRILSSGNSGVAVPGIPGEDPPSSSSGAGRPAGAPGGSSSMVVHWENMVGLTPALAPPGSAGTGQQNSGGVSQIGDNDHDGDDNGAGGNGAGGAGNNDGPGTTQTAPTDGGYAPVSSTTTPTTTTKPKKPKPTKTPKPTSRTVVNAPITTPISN